MRLISWERESGRTTVSLFRSHAKAQSPCFKAYCRPTLLPPANPRFPPVGIKTRHAEGSLAVPSTELTSLHLIGFVKRGVISGARTEFVESAANSPFAQQRMCCRESSAEALSQTTT